MARRNNKNTGVSAMGQRSNAPLTEPEIVPCLFVTGAAIDTATGCVRIVGWNHVPALGGETEERRVVVRVALPPRTAHDLAAQLQDVLDALLRGVH